MPPPELRSIRPSDAPDLVASLLGELEASLRQTFPSRGPRHASSLAQEHRSGQLEIWVGGSPDGSCESLAYVQRAADGIRVHGLVVRPPSVQSIRSALEAIALEVGTPIAVVTDGLPSVPVAAQVSALPFPEYWHREKVFLRRGTGVRVPESSAPITVRRVRPDDRQPLAHLFLSAYTERPGEFWVWTAADPAADVQRNLEDFFEPAPPGGAVPDLEASLVAELEGHLVGAVLVEGRVPDRRYIGDVMVLPEYHRRGIGRHLLSSTLRALSEPPTIVELSAIRYGAPYWLYRDLGFEEATPPDGRLEGHWVRGPDPTISARGRAGRTR